MNTKKTKIVVLVLALALVLGGVIGGTLAWLVAETPAVTNTFTVGNIDITLTETAATAENNYAPSFKMVPGATIAKDPVVTVVKGSEACWLFVEITANGTGDYLEYEVADGWTQINDTNVWGRQVGASTADQAFPVIKDNKVTVKSSVTKAMMDAIVDGAGPTLTFTAYAIQSANLVDKDGNPVSSAAAAWEIYKNPPQQPNN